MNCIYFTLSALFLFTPYLHTIIPPHSPNSHPPANTEEHYSKTIDSHKNGRCIRCFDPENEKGNFEQNRQNVKKGWKSQKWPMHTVFLILKLKNEICRLESINPTPPSPSELGCLMVGESSKPLLFWFTMKIPSVLGGFVSYISCPSHYFFTTHPPYNYHQGLRKH